MSATVGLLEESWQSEVLAGLQQFGVQPEWLLAALQRERVIDGLQRHIPEFAAGALQIQDCEPVRPCLEGDRWVVFYRLTVEGPEPERRQVVSVQGILHPPGAARVDHAIGRAGFGTDTWRCFLPELGLELWMRQPDMELEALPRLTDPEQARALLEAAMHGAQAYREIRIQACTPRIARHKPGRCTILYRLEYPGELAAGHDWPDVVVAKTYSSDKGQNAYEGMRKLWASPLAKGDIVTIAEPIAYFPELKVLVQGPIREEWILKDVIKSALRAGTPEALQALHDYMRKTAAGLAALHQSGARHGETITWADAITEIREVIAQLAVTAPQLADAAEPMLTRLEALAAIYPADPPLPAHRTFRPAQVLIHQGKIGFIDFDGFCQAEPALDVALFRATIKDIGMNEPLSSGARAVSEQAARLARLAQLEAISEIFLAQYEASAPISRQRVALWEALDIFTYVLHCWTKVRPPRLNNDMFILEQHLSSMSVW